MFFHPRECFVCRVKRPFFITLKWYHYVECVLAPHIMRQANYLSVIAAIYNRIQKSSQLKSLGKFSAKMKKKKKNDNTDQMWRMVVEVWNLLIGFCIKSIGLHLSAKPVDRTGLKRNVIDQLKYMSNSKIDVVIDQASTLNLKKKYQLFITDEIQRLPRCLKADS